MDKTATHTSNSDIAFDQCDFCSEFLAKGVSVFERLYAASGLHSRIVAEREGFVAVPSLGQVVPGMMLILPRRHVETMADLESCEQTTLAEIVQSVITTVSKMHENVLVFEHGAFRATGASCGIYHAHLHVVPTPRAVRPDELAGEEWTSTTSLSTALTELRGCSQYLLTSDNSVWSYMTLESRPNHYKSQHFRRTLENLFEPGRGWNWREIEQVEPRLLECLQLFGTA